MDVKLEDFKIWKLAEHLSKESVDSKRNVFHRLAGHLFNEKLDPVGSTVRYEMMKLCTGSVWDTMKR